jgi:hypothetical protein
MKHFGGIEFDIKGFLYTAYMIDDCLVVFDEQGNEVFDLAIVDEAYENYWASIEAVA